MMEKHVRFGLLATVAMHMLSAGIWWVSTSRFQSLPPDELESPVIEVQLRGSREEATADSVGPASQILSAAVPRSDTSDEHAFASSEVTATPTGSLILPAEELSYTPAGELD